MSDAMEDREILAAEYVLGTLDETEQARAAALVAEDPAFAALVEAWNRRLIAGSEAIPPLEPPERVWRNIQAALRERSERLQSPQAAAPHLAMARPPLLAQLAFWRWSTAAMGAVAAALAFLLFSDLAVPPGPPAEGRYVAVLGEGAQQPAWVVTVDLAAKSLTIRPVAEVAVADRDLELWLVAGDQAPQSLGLLSAEQPVSLPVAAVAADFAPGPAALAVSLEPLGGSPTGLPTGPVVYQGALLAAPQGD